MTGRHQSPGPPPRPRLAFAPREALRDGYGPGASRADLLAGAVVGIVAGGRIALLGGSRAQVSGPTAQPLRVMARAGWKDRHGRLAIYRSFDKAGEEARKALA